MKSVATDGKGGNGLKFENVGSTFCPVLMLCLKIQPETLLWLVLSDLFDIFLITLQEHFPYGKDTK